MGLPQTETQVHLYPHALQLKLYQAFIFSVPILFSVILFLLFYLFYLKRRDSNLSSPSSSPATLPRRMNQPRPVIIPLPVEMGLKEDLKVELPIIMFDEDLKAKDSQCCVCLGDFELDEQLHQIPSCKHMFHIDCIHHWLRANSTCPLCRCSILPARKLNSDPPVRFNILQPSDANSGHGNGPQLSSSEQELVGVVGRSSLNHNNFSREEDLSRIEESTSERTCLTESGNSQESNSVVVQIQIPAP